MDLFIHSRDNDKWHVDDEFEGRSGRRYTLGERITAGGNAVIHRCYDKITGDEFAVKFQLRLQRNRQQRFRQEVEILRNIRHDHVTRHRDDGFIVGNGPRRNWRLQFLIMDMASKDLATVMKEQPSIPYETYIAQFRGLAWGLALLHQRAIHRDIKPDNILLFGQRWALSDLGLCQIANSNLTAHDELVGPRLWMSPEAVNKACGCHDAILKASDVFQLATVFWFVVTRRHPTGVVTRADYTGPAHLFDLFYRCLAHDHRQRPTDGEDFAKQLEAAIDTAPTVVAAPVIPRATPAAATASATASAPGARSSSVPESTTAELTANPIHQTARAKTLSAPDSESNSKHSKQKNPTLTSPRSSPARSRT
jgi:eukaryotic-like serine/threonine-protein kinase